MSSPLDRTLALIALLRAFHKECEGCPVEELCDQAEALVAVARAALGPLADGRMHMTSGELRCPECHSPAPWHHLEGCKYGEALSRLAKDTAA